MREMPDKVLAQRDDVRLPLGQFSADSLLGHVARGRDYWREDCHAYLLREISCLAHRYPQMAGAFRFCFADYRDPLKYPVGHWGGLNPKGVVMCDHRRKRAVFAIQDACAPLA